MSDESTSVSDRHSTASGAPYCSLATYFRCRPTECENFEKIFNGLRGKLDSQALTIKGIADKKFEPKHHKKVFSNDEEPMAAPSTNKWDVLSVADWTIILARVTKEQVVHRSVAQSREEMALQDRVLLWRYRLSASVRKRWFHHHEEQQCLW